MREREFGQIKWWNKQKGFGFVQYGRGQEVFIHISSLLDNSIEYLIEGQTVEFEVIQGRQGLITRNVVVYDDKD